MNVLLTTVMNLAAPQIQKLFVGTKSSCCSQHLREREERERGMNENAFAALARGGGFTDAKFCFGR